MELRHEEAVISFSGIGQSNMSVSLLSRSAGLHVIFLIHNYSHILSSFNGVARHFFFFSFSSVLFHFPSKQDFWYLLPLFLVHKISLLWCDEALFLSRHILFILTFVLVIVPVCWDIDSKPSTKNEAKQEPHKTNQRDLQSNLVCLGVWCCFCFSVSVLVQNETHRVGEWMAAVYILMNWCLDECIQQRRLLYLISCWCVCSPVTLRMSMLTC